jgi:hypothetical protein
MRTNHIRLQGSYARGHGGPLAPTLFSKLNQLLRDGDVLFVSMRRCLGDPRTAQRSSATRADASREHGDFSGHGFDLLSEQRRVGLQ